jgi:Spy/CpxP family protein refolding chaperone
MTSRTLRITGIVAAVAAAGLMLTVVAFGGGDSRPGAFLHFGHHAHGGDCGHGEHEHFAALVADLDLSDDQHRHLESIHEIFGSQHSAVEDVHAELMQWTIDRLEQGDLTAAEVREVIDQRLEQVRNIAYQIGDEAVAFANSLDDTQRGVLVEHLRQAQ